MSSYSSVFEEIELDEEIQESIKYEKSNQYISEAISYNAETHNFKDPPNIIHQKMLLLLRKKNQANFQMKQPERPSEFLAKQIQKLKSPQISQPNSYYKKPADPYLVNKLKVNNLIQSIKDDSSSDLILAENEMLKEQMKKIEKQEFIKRQIFRLGSKNC